MNRNLIGTFGFVLILVGVALPFAGLQQSGGDILPLLVGGATFLVGVGLLVRAIKPEAFRAYALVTCSLGAVAVLLMIVIFVSSSGERTVSDGGQQAPLAGDDIILRPVE